MWIRIRAVIIEDEPLATQSLAALLDDTCQVDVIGSVTESEAGLPGYRFDSYAVHGSARLLTC